MNKVITIRPGIKVTQSDKPDTKKICGPIPSDEWKKKKDDEEALLKSRIGVITTVLADGNLSSINAAAPTIVISSSANENLVANYRARKSYEQDVFEHLLKNNLKLKQLPYTDGKLSIGLYLKDEETPFTSITVEKENGAQSMPLLWLTKCLSRLKRLYEQIRLPGALQSLRFKRSGTFDQV